MSVIDIYGNQLAGNRTIFVSIPQQAIELIQLQHPGFCVQLLEVSSGLYQVEVKESEQGTAIASYSVKTW